MSSPPRTSRRNPFAIGVAAVLLAAAVFVSFWVPIYARHTPKLGAFPFFYWFQLLLVPAVAIVSWLAYLLVKSDSGTTAAADAAAQPGESPGSAGQAGPAGPAGPAATAEDGPEVAL